MSNIISLSANQLVRSSLRLALANAGYSTMIDAESLEQTLQILTENHIDLIIIDFTPCDEIALHAVESLRSKNWEGGIIVISDKRDDLFSHRCKNAGAQGIIGKSDGMVMLPLAMRAALQGYTLFPQHNNCTGAPVALNSHSGNIVISQRERQVLKYLAQGKNNTEIGGILDISHKTVSTFKRKLLTKLDIHSTAELAAFAREHKMD
ncbi:hypothetical protein CIG19_02490 [Enterobacterales bacterium CwR94]|nr:hypothetical protein CIG19_02490 [Enterobacterales bacterium CwR94]